MTVITLSYNNVLKSFFTVPLKKETVTTFAKLSKAVGSGSYACRIANGTYDLHLLLASK